MDTTVIVVNLFGKKTQAILRMETTFTKHVIHVVVKDVRNVSKHFITILLPTRKRTKMVQKSVAGLLDLTRDAKRIHIAVAYDHDDEESQTYFSSFSWHNLVEPTGATQSVHEIQRLGWMDLHEYYNHLAKSVDSAWYFIWNDDAYMRSYAWDQEIFDNNNPTQMLSMESNGKRPESTLFPCVSKLWVDTFGMIGMNPVDQWIQDITYEIGCYKRISSEIFHDHFQFTGNNNDEVYQETSKNKKFTKRAYKTTEMAELKKSWIAQWRTAINED